MTDLQALMGAMEVLWEADCPELHPEIAALSKAYHGSIKGQTYECLVFPDVPRPGRPELKGWRRR